MVFIKSSKSSYYSQAMEIHFQTTDHVVAVEKVAEQHVGTKYSKCNSLKVRSHIIRLDQGCICGQMQDVSTGKCKSSYYSAMPQATGLKFYYIMLCYS